MSGQTLPQSKKIIIRKSMKIRKKIILFIIVVLGCLAYKMFSYYAPPSAYQPYAIPQKQDDTLRIAYLGDSWAFMHREHKCVIPKIIEDTLHCPVRVHSYGMCGQTSKEFYENIFNNADLKHFLQKRRYEYCFISLGINDTYKKMSTAYYQQSMDYIIRFFLANHIRPIILDIPDYDIYKSFERQNDPRKILRRLSMFINNTPLDCKKQFQNALGEMIVKNNYTKEVSIIRYLSWSKNGEKEKKSLYLNDGMHLNNNGYIKLDSLIANEILKQDNPLIHNIR